MEGFFKSGKTAKAKGLFLFMTSQGGELVGLAYKALLDSFLKVGMVNKACKLLEQMRKKELLPHVAICIAWVHIFCYKRRFDVGKELLEDVKKKGYMPDVETYNTVLMGIDSTGNLDDVEKLVKEMLSYGLSPASEASNTLVLGIYNRGNLMKAHDLAVRLIGIGVSLDVSLCNSLIDGLFLADKVEDAMNLIQLIKVREEDNVMV